MVVEDDFSDGHGLVDAAIQTCDSNISSLLQSATAFVCQGQRNRYSTVVNQEKEWAWPTKQ